MLTCRELLLILVVIIVLVLSIVIALTDKRNIVGGYAERQGKYKEKCDAYNTEEMDAIKKIWEETFDVAEAVLQDNDPQLKYRNGTKDFIPNAVMHFGQRKLLTTEVAFLNWVYENGLVPKSKVVVYAGAAPGFHTALGAFLFPELTFELYDPAPFNFERGIKLFKERDPTIEDRIHAHQEFFTDETCELLVKQHGYDNLVFLSDIRAGHREMNDESEEASIAWERVINDDIASQARWIRLMKPTASSFKFRFPFLEVAKDFPYFEGEIFFQPWVGPASTETRLHVKGVPKDKIYSPSKYEQQLFYHNLVRRSWGYYPHTLEEVGMNIPGLDCCWDCKREIEIWKEYLRLFPTLKRFSNIGEIINAATDVTEQRLTQRPHGFKPEIPMVHKWQEMLDLCKVGKMPCTKRAKQITYQLYDNKKRK